jgi:predicted metalloprotease
MRLDDLRPTENIDDRRGQGGFSFGGGGGGLAIGGGGIVSVVVVILALLFGFDPGQIIDPSGPADPQSQVQGAPPTGQVTNQEAFSLSARIVGSTEEEWSAIFAQHGRRYQPAVFTPYDYATDTAGCGVGQAAMGPFYCPADGRVYIDLQFFRELDQRFGAPGDFAQAYVIAHEVGHHVQQQLGISQQAERYMRGGGPQANQVSVMMELQADCFAGVWANHANQRHRILETGDVEEGLRAASAVGDDTLQEAQGRRSAPDSFTHGSAAQRMQWFQVGLQSGDPDRCDTFGAGRVF